MKTRNLSALSLAALDASNRYLEFLGSFGQMRIGARRAARRANRIARGKFVRK